MNILKTYKFLLSILFCFAFSVYGTSNVPEAVKYQAVIRDNSGNILSNRAVSIKLSVLKNNISGNIVYVETHNVTSSNIGIINIEIGKGNIQSGNFQNINWGDDAYFLKIEVDENGGTNYTLNGVSQLISVPYALYAKEAANGTQWKDTTTNIYYKTGNVGVGTNNPKSSIEVYSGLKSKSQVLISGDLPTMRLTDTTYSGNGFIIGVAADSNDLIPNSSKGDVVFINETYNSPSSYLFGTGVPSETCVKISEDCKVGIGTDDPKTKLDVNGDINISNIGSGVIMQSPDGNCWRLTVSNSGQPVFTTVDCNNPSGIIASPNDTNAVAVYTFNGNANDVSGNGFNGTVHNAQLALDRKGNTSSNSYYFRGYQNGNPDYIDLPMLSQINPSDEISISLWVKIIDTAQSPFLFALVPDNPNDRLVGTYFWPTLNNSPIWDCGNIFGNGRLKSSTNLTLPLYNTWQHLVFIKSASSSFMKVYHNGQLLLYKNSFDNIDNKNFPIRLGGGGYQGGILNGYMVGYLDDVKIFNRALTETEINQLFQE